MIQTLEDKFQTILDEISLSKEDKQILNKMVTYMSGLDDKDEIIKFLIEDKQLILKLVENFKEKKSAIKNQDKEAWKKILRKEKEEIKNIVEE